LANVATIVAGNTSTYVLTTAGAVGAWGDNGHGQLGDKSNVQQNSPEMITLF
jgi:alpha-tubulin suppressor-like RCC1 family protein